MQGTKKQAKHIFFIDCHESWGFLPKKWPVNRKSQKAHFIPEMRPNAEMRLGSTYMGLLTGEGERSLCYLYGNVKTCAENTFFTSPININVAKSYEK